MSQRVLRLHCRRFFSVQCCPNTSWTRKLLVNCQLRAQTLFCMKITYVIMSINYSGTTLHKNIVYSILSECVWDNIVQESYLYSIGPEQTGMFLHKNQLQFQKSHSLLFDRVQHNQRIFFFLLNVGSGVHLWLAGQQWTGADIDWNIIKNIHCFFSMNDSF